MIKGNCVFNTKLELKEMIEALGLIETRLTSIAFKSGKYEDEYLADKVNQIKRMLQK